MQSFHLSETSGALGIIIHLDDEKPPIRVKRERDWIDYQRFGSDELKSKTLSEAKGVEGICGSDGRESWKIFGIHNSLLGGEQ
jgi:hypothetical protein